MVLPRAAGCVLLPAILALAAHLVWGVLLLAKWEALEDLAQETTGVPRVAFGNFSSMHTGAEDAGPSWYVVFAPAWACEFIALSFALMALVHRHGRTGPVARNELCVQLNSMLQSICTATFQLLLAVRLDTEHGAWSVVFLPWYLAIGVQATTHYSKVPDARGRRPGFPIGLQHLLALVVSLKLGGAMDYRTSSWANVLWPLWGVCGFTGVMLLFALCCGLPMLLRRRSEPRSYLQMGVLAVLVLLCATYLPALLAAIRFAAWLDGESSLSAASILGPYLGACSVVLLTLVVVLVTLAFTPASMRTLSVASADGAEEGDEGGGVADLFSSLPTPYALVRESSTLFRRVPVQTLDRYKRARGESGEGGEGGGEGGAGGEDVECGLRPRREEQATAAGSATPPPPPPPAQPPLQLVEVQMQELGPPAAPHAAGAPTERHAAEVAVSAAAGAEAGAAAGAAAGGETGAAEGGGHAASSGSGLASVSASVAASVAASGPSEAGAGAGAEAGAGAGAGGGEIQVTSPPPASLADPSDETDLGEGQVCWICVSGPRDAVLLECGHGGICYGCAERCVRKRPPLCPMCRQRISCVVRLDGPEEQIDGQVVVKVTK